DNLKHPSALFSSLVRLTKISAEMPIDNTVVPPPSVVNAWPAPDASPATHGFQIQAATGVFFGFAIVVAGLRFHVRFRTKTFGLDDWFMLAALVRVSFYGLG